MNTNLPGKFHPAFSIAAVSPLLTMPFAVAADSGKAAAREAAMRLHSNPEILLAGNPAPPNEIRPSPGNLTGRVLGDEPRQARAHFPTYRSPVRGRSTDATHATKTIAALPARFTTGDQTP